MYGEVWREWLVRRSVLYTHVCGMNGCERSLQERLPTKSRENRIFRRYPPFRTWAQVYKLKAV